MILVNVNVYDLLFISVAVLYTQGPPHPREKLDGFLHEVNSSKLTRLHCLNTSYNVYVSCYVSMHKDTMSPPRLYVTTEMLVEMSSMQRKSSIRNYLHRFPLFRFIHPTNQHKHTSIPIKSCTKLKLLNSKKARGIAAHAHVCRSITKEVRPACT